MVPLWIAQLLFAILLLASGIVVLTAFNVVNDNDEVAGYTNAIHLAK